MKRTENSLAKVEIIVYGRYFKQPLFQLSYSSLYFHYS